MRFASIGSGSKGNGTLIEVGSTRVLMDCGFSIGQVEQRMARLGCSPDQLDAIVVTHEHGDHIKGVGALARRYKLPVWLTYGTARHQHRLGKLSQQHYFSSHEAFSIGDISIEPYPVPHDASEPAQFVFSDGARRLGILTDVGCWTPHIERCLSDCDALVLECNHDVSMLSAGPYPPSLKQRVGGRHGHLSNTQAAELLSRLETGKLQHLVAAHLSEENNSPELAAQALAEVMSCGTDWIAIANQEQGLDWRDVV